MAKIDDKVAMLEAKLAQAKAEKQKRDARLRTAENAVKRKADNAAKFLLGAASLAAIRKGTIQVEGMSYLFQLLTEKDRKRLSEAFSTLGIETPASRP